MPTNDKMKVMNSNLLAVEYIEEVKYAYNSLNTDLFQLMTTSIEAYPTHF
jgi:methyl-accepting chemotaxis protein